MQQVKSVSMAFPYDGNSHVVIISCLTVVRTKQMRF